MKKLWIVQGYTGEIARHQIRLTEACPSLELVGAYVHHEEKHGVDAGTIAGVEPIGVLATSKLPEILALDADCVLYNPPTERYDEIIPMLASGKNVISIIAGWHPQKRRSYPAIKEACEAGQSSLFGTGLNPGLSYELALLASSICSRVDSIYIKTCEPQSSLSVVFLELFGFGKQEEELKSGARGVYAIFARSLHQVTDLLCEELGLAHDGTEFEPATRDYDDKILVKKGTMAGLLLRAPTTLAGAPVATIELRFLLGLDYVRDSYLDGAPKQGWLEVDVRGTPGSRITHEIYAGSDTIGTLATGTKAVNCIPFVCAAKPGLRSPLDLPLGRMLPNYRSG